MKLKYLLTFVLFFSMVSPAYASIVTGTVTTGVTTGINVNGVIVSAPTANPIAGEYTATTQVVTLAKSAGATSIHYTVDGSAATCTSGTTYTTAITIATNTVMEAVACYPNGITSPKLLAAYVINPPTPAVSSGGGGGGDGGIITTPSSSTEDFNSDGKVDIFDFNVMMTNWGAVSGATKITGDANGDHKVDILDFNLLIASWNA